MFASSTAHNEENRFFEHLNNLHISLEFIYKKKKNAVVPWHLSQEIFNIFRHYRLQKAYF